MSGDDLTVFIHIPKCAGSSIRESVRTTIGDRLFAAYSAEQRELVRKTPIKAVEGKAALFGHFEFPVAPSFLPRTRYFTVLRDPVERLVSLLAYTRWNKTAPHAQIISSLSDRDALTVLLQPSFGHSTEMTRFFGRAGDAIPAYNIARRHFSHIGHIEDIDATFEWLREHNMSDGTPLRINNTKDRYEVSRADRAFIRAHLHEDMKLYDLLVA